MKKNKYLIIFAICLSTFCISVQAKYEYNAINCGDLVNIPAKALDLTSYIITIIQVAVPVILVIVSIIDLVKAISSQKEDEIKKGEQTLIKRIITAALIFFVIAIVKLVVSVVSNSAESSSIIKCIDCFVSGSESCK